MLVKEVILFDGICNLCNRFINFVIKHDKKRKYSFSPLQSNYSKQYLQTKHRKNTELYTVYLIKGQESYEKSTAVIKIITSFSGLWKLAYVFYLIPLFLRDKVYELIARKRYSIFGKRSSCMLPPVDYKNRFLP